MAKKNSVFGQKWSKSEYFLIRTFWIGRDPPPLLTESKKKTVFYASPYNYNYNCCCVMLSTSRCKLVEAVVWCSDEVQQLQLRLQLHLQLLLCDVISMWTSGVSCVMLRCSGEVQQAVAASNSSQLPTNSITNVIKYQLATVPAYILECNNYTHTNDAKLTKDHCGHHFKQFVMTILTLSLGREGGKCPF